MPKKTEKRVRHRHKWVQEAVDCPVCGAGLVVLCRDCGEVKEDLPSQGKGKKKPTKRAKK